jgi:putative SOS response-associated peptidase YedK
LAKDSGRFTRSHKPAEVAERFDVEFDLFEETAAPRYNIAPSQIVPVIRQVDGREVIDCKWDWFHSGRKMRRSAMR